MTDKEFKHQKCLCNGSPTCQECNDFGGFDLNDDYKRAWAFKKADTSIEDKIMSEEKFDALFRERHLKDSSLLNTLDLPEYKKSKDYKRREIRKALLIKSMKRIVDWQNLYEIDTDEDRKIMVGILIDNLSILIHKLESSV